MNQPAVWIREAIRSQKGEKVDEWVGRLRDFRASADENRGLGKKTRVVYSFILLVRSPRAAIFENIGRETPDNL